jgi:hypothetical protein
MGLFKSKQNANKKFSQNNRSVKYVWLASDKAIFIIEGEPRANQYSYGVQIKPLQGLYYSSKDKRKYTANELSGYHVILNIHKNTSKEDLEKLEKGKVVIIGYAKDAIIIESGEE